MEVRGHLDLLLLATLAGTGPIHGYGLISALRDRSGGTFDLPEGTVYPALHKLERVGLIASRWDDSTPRRRRVYELTEAGFAAREARQREWAGFVRGMQAVVGTVGRSAGPLAASGWSA